MRWESEPEDEGPPPQRLAEGLDRVLAGLGSPPVAVMTKITEHWAEIAGYEAARVSTPVAVEEGRLVVAVEAPAWVSQLRWMEADVVRRVGELVGPGVVTRVAVRGLRRGR